MNKNSVLIFGLLLCFSSTGFGQAARKYSNEFLAIGIGARGLAMANAQVAVVNDVTSGYWNPAGLSLINNDMQVAFMHSEYFAGIAKFDYGSIALPTQDKSKYIGFSLIRFGVDNIPNTLFMIEPDGSINYDNIIPFSIADYAFIFSFAQQVQFKEHKIRAGANAKVVHRIVGSFARSWGFGLDAGAQYDYKNWHFGVMARDITTTFNAWSASFTDEEKQVLIATNNEVPENSLEITLPKIILGVAYDYDISKKFGILAEIDLDITTDGRRNVLISAKPFSIEPHLGIEGNYNQFIFLRMGINNIQKATDDVVAGKTITTIQPNMGLGLKIKTVTIDYALTDIGNFSQSLYSNVISVKIDIIKRELLPGWNSSKIQDAKCHCEDEVRSNPFNE